MAGIGKTGTTTAVPSGAMTAMEALALLQQALSGEEQTPDPGFMTRKDWATAWGLGESQTYRLLQNGVAAGKVESKKFKVRTGSLLRSVVHYRVIVLPGE